MFNLISTFHGHTWFYPLDTLHVDNTTVSESGSVQMTPESHYPKQRKAHCFCHSLPRHPTKSTTIHAISREDFLSKRLIGQDNTLHDTLHTKQK